jgi:hypothetical protein
LAQSTLIAAAVLRRLRGKISAAHEGLSRFAMHSIPTNGKGEVI